MEQNTELRQFFQKAGASEEQTEHAIEKLGISSIEELAYFTNTTDYAEVGIESRLMQYKLVEQAQEIKNNREKCAGEEQNAQPIIDSRNLLVTPQDDEEWLKAIRQDGLLHFGKSTYIAGIKAMLAANVGAFGIVEPLMEMIDLTARQSGRPVPQLYYTLSSLLARRKYGEAFAALSLQLRDLIPASIPQTDGIPIYATDTEMQQLITDIKQVMTPAIFEALDAVKQWYNNLMTQKRGDFFVDQTMNRGNVRKDSYPNPSGIYNAGIALSSAINHTFAGNGIQKAMAICMEYRGIVAVLNDPGLPEAVGVIDRDAVLMKLGLDANVAAVRSENYIIQFILSIIDAEKLSKADELEFCRALYDLACQIDWSALTNDPRDRTRYAQQPFDTSDTINAPSIYFSGAQQHALPGSMETNAANGTLGLVAMDGSAVTTVK